MSGLETRMRNLKNLKLFIYLFTIDFFSHKEYQKLCFFLSVYRNKMESKYSNLLWEVWVPIMSRYLSKTIESLSYRIRNREKLIKSTLLVLVYIWVCQQIQVQISEHLFINSFFKWVVWELIQSCEPTCLPVVRYVSLLLDSTQIRKILCLIQFPCCHCDRLNEEAFDKESVSTISNRCRKLIWHNERINWE